MPVTIVKIEKYCIEPYLIFGGIMICVLAFVFMRERTLRRSGEHRGPGYFIACMMLIAMTAHFSFMAFDIYSKPSEDIHVAYMNTSYSERFLLEGSFPKRIDLRNATSIKEDRLIYKGQSLEKFIDGNEYYIFKLDQIKTDKESVQEIVKKYNQKYKKHITDKDVVIVKSDNRMG